MRLVWNLKFFKINYNNIIILDFKSTSIIIGTQIVYNIIARTSIFT